MSGLTEWRDLAMKVEDLGFDALYVADHLGLTPSPFSALAAAADATSTLRLVRMSSTVVSATRFLWPATRQHLTCCRVGD